MQGRSSPSDSAVQCCLAALPWISPQAAGISCAPFTGSGSPGGLIALFRRGRRTCRWWRGALGGVPAALAQAGRLRRTAPFSAPCGLQVAGLATRDRCCTAPCALLDIPAAVTAHGAAGLHDIAQ